MGLNGIKKIYVDDDIHILIQENERIDISIVDGNNNVVESDYFNKFIGFSDDDKIILVIQRFLMDFKIYGFKKILPIIKGSGQESIVYGNNGNNQLRMRLYNPKYRVLSNIIREKFREDRYNYFWNSDIKNIVIDSSRDMSKYEKNGDCINLFLRTDRNNNVIMDEKIFLTEFLNYKFEELGKEIKIRGIFEESSHSFNRKLIGHIIECGDMKITFPNRYEFSFIYSIVNNYNEKLFQIKREEKKRQLKLEGF